MTHERREKTISESRLVYECMQLLGKHGAVFRTNAGRYYTRSGQTVTGLPRGFSDILFIRQDGRACFVELKKKGNKASPEQEKFISKMQSMGALAGVAYTPEQAAQICGIELAP